MPELHVNGINIYYEIKGEGFPLVMIMGLGANMDWWTPELEDKLAKNFKLILFDNRGAGRTDAPKEDYTIPLFAKDTVDLMTGLGIEKASIFGISMGGMIAQQVALSYPERIGKLVLGCTHCGTRHSVLPSPEVLSVLVNPMEMNPERLLNLLFPEDYIAQNPGKIQEFIKRYMIAPITPDALMRQVGAIMAFESHSRLGEINTPTLVITGDADILIPPENSKIIAERIPGAKLTVLKGSGHGFTAQEPEIVSDILLEFLK
ncbi:MAG: alpha/beta fold hydrolase [Bacillota bacterium]